MRKTKAKKIRKVVYLSSGTTLADVIRQVTESGVADFSTVSFDHDYVGCQCDHDGGYCYCDGSYRDERFVWEI